MSVWHEVEICQYDMSNGNIAADAALPVLSGWAARLPMAPWRFQMRIDVHSHYMSKAVLDDIGRLGHKCETPLEIRADGGMFIHTPERPYGPIKPTFYDLGQRLEYLDRLEIDRQVLTAPPFLFYYWINNVEAAALMQSENDAIASAVAEFPNRFIGFATVMLNDVSASIVECQRAKQNGMLGVEIGSNVNDVALSDSQFFPFFEALESAGLAIAIHPHNVVGRDLMNDFHLRNLIGFPTDTTLAAANLIFSGVLDRFPNLRICLGQAGGFLPYIIGRLDAGYYARPECRRIIKNPPSAYLRRFYYDTIIHSPKIASFLIEMVGANRLMLGTDYPFDMGATSPTVDLDAQTHLSSEQIDQINWRTAAEFLRLPHNAA
jgi:aminocarboxymuconate-semialdehyde decarboxylase